MIDSEYRARWSVIHHLLGLIVRSRLVEFVALRGSLLMKAWYGEAAREPKDIDWVVLEEGVRYKPTMFHERMANFLRLVAKHPEAGEWTISFRKIYDEPINSDGFYKRLVGRRLIFPWRGADNLSGSIQMDFAYDQSLHVSPSWTTIAIADHPPLRVLAASKEESLIWKLLWLEADSRNFEADTQDEEAINPKPKGKDLYDAVLLAEDIPLPRDLFQNMFPQVEYEDSLVQFEEAFPTEEFPLAWNVDWDSFLMEHPSVAGSASDWQLCLALALSHTFTLEERERAVTALSFP